MRREFPLNQAEEVRGGVEWGRSGRGQWLRPERWGLEEKPGAFVGPLDGWQEFLPPSTSSPLPQPPLLRSERVRVPPGLSAWIAPASSTHPGSSEGCRGGGEPFRSFHSSAIYLTCLFVPESVCYCRHQEKPLFLFSWVV